MPQIIADNLAADGYRPVCAAVTAAALSLLATPVNVVDALRTAAHAYSGAGPGL